MTALAELVAARLAAARALRQPAFIHIVSDLAAREAVAQVEARRARGEPLPLMGLAFAVKDNIDVAGLPTTAGYPHLGRAPHTSAPVVEWLCEAGAIVVGKTNLDQFATGLVGTRSPYGACHSVFDERYIAGGSSSGSAVAVATGVADFALGTDTAGSGRVPAAFNALVGLKPTRGLVSTRGVVPACRTLDCVSVFAPTCEVAARVLAVAARYDAGDAYARQLELSPPRQGALRVGVPPAEELDFFGDDAAARLYAHAIERLTALGHAIVPVAFEPFARDGALLYEGPWLAERYAAVGMLVEQGTAGLDPTVATVIRRGASLTAVEAFRGLYELAELKRQTEHEWARMDVLALPTTGTIYTREAVAQDPIGLNARLGRYTNFANLLDLAAVAVPAGFRPDGLPLGITLFGPPTSERTLLTLGADLHAAVPRTAT